MGKLSDDRGGLAAGPVNTSCPSTPQTRSRHRSRGSFLNDDAARKLLYLAIKNAGLR